MLFKPYLAEAILQGKKTQTRRLKKPTHNSVHRDGHIIAVYIRSTLPQNNRLLWRVGKTYAIQPGRGKKAVGHFRLLGIRQEPLRAISHKDARAKGLDNVQAFANLWNDINPADSQWKDNPQVFVLTFELVTSK